VATLRRRRRWFRCFFPLCHFKILIEIRSVVEIEIRGRYDGKLLRAISSILFAKNDPARRAWSRPWIHSCE